MRVPLIPLPQTPHYDNGVIDLSSLGKRSKNPFVKRSSGTLIGHVYGGIEARATSPADCANVWRSTDSQASNCIFKVYLFLD